MDITVYQSRAESLEKALWELRSSWQDFIGITPLGKKWADAYGAIQTIQLELSKAEAGEKSLFRSDGAPCDFSKLLPALKKIEATSYEIRRALGLIEGTRV